VSATIGCIADDYTGGTDVAAALRRHGLRTVLLFGAPDDSMQLQDCDAVVVALKSRALDAARAVKLSLDAQGWLSGRGVDQVYFKYCSTFDSTDVGNIGPVADALLQAAAESVTIICPAAPEHGRTLYNGHLFVGDRLLSESSMARHPLTPMTDSDIVAVLRRQTPHPVALIPLPVVRRGSAEIAVRIAALRADGVRYIVIDAMDEADLLAIAAAGVDLGVITGSAGLAGALGKVLHDRDLNCVDPPSVPAPAGPIAIFAGSCSQATLGQVAHAIERYPSYRLDPRTVENTTDLYPDALAWMAENLGTTPVLMYSSAPASERGPADATVAAELERMMGGLAAAAVAGGAHRIIVAGGETSGAVVDALGVKAVLVNAEMDTGVPWCSTVDTNPVTLLLNSGNFGKPDLLVRAATVTELG
jgi:3-dehydrotetronate 4-kinase